MESWRKTFRNGFAKVLSPVGLEALRVALEYDEPELVQGTTTTPPPLMCVRDWPCEAADAIAFACWKGQTLETVGEVEEAFAYACFNADKALGGAGECRWFLNWYDDAPRAEMRRELLAEVERAIEERTDAALAAPGNVFRVENGDRYLSVGKADGRGEPLLVSAECPQHLRELFEVPKDGIELRHGPLMAC